MNAVVTTQPATTHYFDDDGYLHFLIQERRHWNNEGNKALEIVIIDLPMSPYLKAEYHIIQVAAR
ncbi:MAG: hypothetical protein ACMXYG_07660 [Candidatus Woesearchaeota archaeon]